MVQLQWKDRYNIGYGEIDAQHRSLLDLVNELSGLVGERQDPAVVGAVFSRLCDYVRVHFTTEERLLEACGYARLADHRDLHARFIDKLLELNRSFDPADPHLLSETSDFLKHWYLEHITKADQDYAPILQRHPPESPVRALIFDFGNVQYRFDNGRFLAGLSRLCGRSAEELKRAIYDDSSLSLDYEAGRIDSPTFLAGRARSHPGFLRKPRHAPAAAGRKSRRLCRPARTRPRLRQMPAPRLLAQKRRLRRGQYRQRTPLRRGSSGGR